MAFHNDGQIVPDSQVVRDFLHSYAIDAECSFVIADSGIENTTCLITLATGQRFALRVYRRDKKTSAAIDQEAAFVTALHAEGLPVPLLHRTKSGGYVSQLDTQGHRWLAVLMDYMTGVHPEHYSSALLADMALAQSRMHRAGVAFVDHQPRRPRLRHLVEAEFGPRIDMARVRSSELRDFLARSADYTISIDPALEYAYSHYDFDRGNILVADSGHLTAILDFDDMQYAPLALCLAYTLYDVYEDTTDEMLVQTYLDQYSTVRSLPDLERQWLPIIMLFRHYVLSTLRILNGHTEPADVRRYTTVESRLMKLSLTQELVDQERAAAIL